MRALLRDAAAKVPAIVAISLIPLSMMWPEAVGVFAAGALLLVLLD